MPKFTKVQRPYYDTTVTVPVIPNLAQLILEQVEAKPETFDMGSWHGDETCDGPKVPSMGYRKCGTTHCVAGWAVVIAGAAGRKLELEVGDDTEDAARLLFEASALGENFPSFYGCERDALESLREFARREADVIASQELDGTKAVQR